MVTMTRSIENEFKAYFSFPNTINIDDGCDMANREVSEDPKHRANESKSSVLHYELQNFSM